MSDQSVISRNYWRESAGSDPAGQDVSRGYLLYLLLFATGGWSMAAYDFNLQVMSLSNIAHALGLSSTQVGLFGFFVDFAEFVCTLVFGWYMDRHSRRTAWIVALAGTTVFTGITFFCHQYWELCVVRALASGLAYTELAISITLVNESLPVSGRGLYYSIVQAGWPIGVMFAAVVYLIAIPLGWNYLFIFGVPPFIAVVLGRIWIREPERFRRIKQIRDAWQAGRKDDAQRFSDQYDIPLEAALEHRVKELFDKNHRRQTWTVLTAFFFYGASFVVSNLYVIYWLTHYVGYSARGAVLLLLGCAAIGIGFYIGAGWLGERVSRRRILFVTALFMPLFALGFMWLHSLVWAGVLYFCLYQVTNGTWSGVAYTYAAESYPTKLRGSGVSLTNTVMVCGYVFGAAIWTGMISHFNQHVVWGIIAVGLSFGTWAIWFGKDFDPRKSLE